MSTIVLPKEHVDALKGMFSFRAANPDAPAQPASPDAPAVPENLEVTPEPALDAVIPQPESQPNPGPSPQAELGIRPDVDNATSTPEPATLSIDDEIANELAKLEQEASQKASPKKEETIDKQAVKKEYDDALIQYFRKRYGHDTVSSVDDVFSTIDRLHEAVSELSNELESTRKAVAPEDPYIKELISLYQAGNGVDDIIEGLSLLKADPSARLESGAYKMSDEDVVRTFLRNSSIPDDAIDRFIEDKLDTNPVEFKLLANDYRDKLAAQHNAKFARLREIKAQAKDKVDLSSQEKEESLEGFKQYLKAAKDSLPKVDTILGVKINPEKYKTLANVVYNSIAESRFIDDIFLDENGETDFQRVFEIYSLYSSKVPAKVRQNLRALAMPDVESIRKEEQRKLAEQRMNLTDNLRDRGRPDVVPQKDKNVYESILEAARQGKLKVS